MLRKICRETHAIMDVELRKSKREPLDLITRAIQPILWLTIFGQVFEHMGHLAPKHMNYLTFLTPGILAQSILFSSIFYGISVIWERDLGIVHKLIVSPAYRVSLVLGKALTAGLRSSIQVFIIYCVAMLLDVKLNQSLFAFISVFCTVVLGAALFSTFSLIIACLVKTRERFMGIGQVLTMPLFFASNAIYPIDLMPHWLQVIAQYNPLTYLVDALRGLLIFPSHSVYGLVHDFSILVSTFVILMLIAGKLYPRLVR